MAIEVRHSRTATLVDSGANPGYDADEIQAADWNAAHPITGDGLGLLFSNSAGAVAETMTVDMGTLTASTPLTFKQKWDDFGVDFEGFVVEIDDAETGGGGSSTSKYFSVRAGLGSGYTDYFRVSSAGTELLGPLSLYNFDFMTGSPAITIDPQFGRFTLTTVAASGNYQAGSFFITVIATGDVTTYGPGGITKTASADFTLPISETAIATWAGAPSTSDVASGYAQVGKDTSTGNVWLAVNDGGTIKKVQLV